MEYQTLLDEIRELAGLPDSAAADQTATATVEALGHVLADDQRRRVAAALPGELRDSMARDGVAAPGSGEAGRESGFVAEIAGRCGCTTGQARLRAQVTLAVLAHHEPEVFSSLESSDWFDQVSPIPLGGRPSPLTHGEVQRAVDELPDWTGDIQQLSRRVVVGPDESSRLQSAVEAVLRQGGGHVERTADGLTIALEGRADSMTPYDVELAGRVEDLLVAAGAAIRRPKAADDGEPLVLFGGRGTDGWRMCGAGSFDQIDAAIQGRGGMGMLWYADREFADFLLTLDWRATHPSDIGGVLIRFPDPGDDPWVALAEGYEIQLCDIGEGVQSTGAICGIQAPYAEPAVKPPGEWNHLEIQARGANVRVGVNGHEVTSYTVSRAEHGYVGVQNHNNDSRLQYRNIWVFEDTE